MKENRAETAPGEHMADQTLKILGDDPLQSEQKKKKKRITRLLILLCLCLIPILIWLQLNLFSHDVTVPVNSNVLIFVIINANVLLVLLVLFLVLRNLAELFLERRKSLVSTRLKTKLVISFLTMALIPTILLFFVALQFVSTSMDYWFNTNIENSLQESLSLAQNLLQKTEEQAVKFGGDIRERLQEISLHEDQQSTSSKLEATLNFQTRYGPDSLVLISDDGSIEISAAGPKLIGIKLPAIPVTLSQELHPEESKIIIQESINGDLVRSVTRVSLGKGQKEALLVTTILLEQNQLTRMETISGGIERYRQLKYLKGPFKFWLLIVLVIVTLLIIFGAIWFGLFISKGITEPVARLAEATKRIAEGDTEFIIEEKSNDEIGLLVEAFNQMTANLADSNRKLAETLAALHLSSQEAEQRRRYIEVILQNVSTGVISIDEEGRIITINRFAEMMLNIKKELFLNKRYRETLITEYASIIDSFLEKLSTSQKPFIEEHLRISVRHNTFSLMLNITRMEDENGIPLGYVMVFDDLTKIEKMQRMAAWREVARRIAHEIKNPLTPIQLSAQRLRKRYPEILEEKDSILDKCTRTIINQVDELKRLVSEFSQFARMPKINKATGNLKTLADETLFLYKEAHRDIAFTCVELNAIPPFLFDAEQIKRCLINLLDNAVAVVTDEAKIDVELDCNDESAFIRVKDNGPGTTSEDKAKLFEPYFSTKKTGTGLGLAIVSTIIADHSGYIRITDNVPHGAVFTIELPLICQKE